MDRLLYRPVQISFEALARSTPLSLPSTAKLST